jgi:hypothetical protein
MMKRIYLVLAVTGSIAPYFFFFQFFSTEGVSLNGFVSALFVNGAVSGFTADLLITSLVFWIAMYQQWGKGKGPNPILFIALNLLIGLSCALPAYLYVREGEAARD